MFNFCFFCFFSCCSVSFSFPFIFFSFCFVFFSFCFVCFCLFSILIDTCYNVVDGSKVDDEDEDEGEVGEEGEGGRRSRTPMTTTVEANKNQVTLEEVNKEREVKDNRENAVGWMR